MTTNSATLTTRAEKRRIWKSVKKKQDYDNSGFLDWHEYKQFAPKTVNKYMPHIGNKQKGIK